MPIIDEDNMPTIEDASRDERNRLLSNIGVDMLSPTRPERKEIANWFNTEVMGLDPREIPTLDAALISEYIMALCSYSIWVQAQYNSLVADANIKKEQYALYLGMIKKTIPGGLSDKERAEHALALVKSTPSKNRTPDQSKLAEYTQLKLKAESDCKTYEGLADKLQNMADALKKELARREMEGRGII